MSAATAGLSVMTLSVVMNISAGITGSILPRMVRYKTIPMIGLVIAIAAVLALAWQAQDLPLLQFEVLLALIGLGFGAVPPLAATVLQNSVSIHQFGSAVATMQFSRNLYCTFLVAAFGAIVLAGAPEIGAAMLPEYSADGFVRVFYAAAASFAVALVAVALLEVKPLQTSQQ